MKIGIIGLQPRQISDVSGRKFNGHELEFYTQKSFAAESVAAFVRKVDRVVLITTGAPKNVVSLIPYTKRHTMAGSISTVIRYLDSLPSDEAASAPVKDASKSSAKVEAMVKQTAVAPKRPLSNEELVKIATQVSPPKKLFSNTPSGYDSQYVWRESASTVEPNASGRYQYDLLDAAEPGDVVRFLRPKGLDAATWKTRITFVRSSRKTHNGQLIEAHFYEKYVDLLVMERRKKPQPVQTVEHVAEPISDKPLSPDQPIESISFPLEERAVEPAVRDSAKPATPEEFQFWRDVFVAVMGDGGTTASATTEADAAVLVYRERSL